MVACLQHYPKPALLFLTQHHQHQHSLDHSGGRREDTVMKSARKVFSAVDRSVIGAPGDVQLYAYPEPRGEVDGTREFNSPRDHPRRATAQAHVHKHSVSHHDLASGVADICQRVDGMEGL